MAKHGCKPPLRRVGERGEGKFEAISWDEAMEEVGKKLGEVREKYGNENVYVSLSSEPRFGLLAGLLGASTYVEPGIDPLFESKTDFQIMKEIAKSLGLDDAMPTTAEEWVRYQVENNDAKTLEGITLDDVLENHGLMPLVGIEKPRIGFVDQGYKTESGRLDVYYEKMVKWGQELPNWEECIEVADDNPARAQFPYQLTQTRSRFLIHSMFYDYNARTFNWAEPSRSAGFSYGDARVPERKRGVMEKCTLCKERTDDGDAPMCVVCCPARARVFGDLDDPESEISKMKRERTVRILLEDKGTHPQVFYVS